MIQLFLVKPDHMIEIPVEFVTWSGQRYHAARKIEASILYNSSGMHHFHEVIEGDTLLFKWKGNELFRGTVFDRSRSKSGMLTLTAYDTLQYFLLNKDVYDFSGKRLDEIVLRMCKDFEIPYAAFADTKHVIKDLLIDTETSLYDIALRAMIETHKASKRKFRLYSRLGKVHLTEITPQDVQWVLGVGNNVIDYNYDTSIEETATRVKLASGEGSGTVTAVVTDDDGKKQFGVLQHYENVSETLGKDALTKKARETLSNKKGVKKKLDIEALGIETLTSGGAVYAIIDDIRVKRSYFIDQDTHLFKGNSHTMNLQLTETDDFPEMAELQKKDAESASSSSASSSTSGASSSKAQEVVTIANSYKGRLRYNFGGKNIPGGSGDCSGFTYYVYNRVGVNIGHGTSTQVAKGRKISRGDARAGDLVFFKGTYRAGVSHVGIVTRPGYCVSLASSGCKEHGYLTSNDSYWGPKFMQINRVL